MLARLSQRRKRLLQACRAAIKVWIWLMKDDNNAWTYVLPASERPPMALPEE